MIAADDDPYQLHAGFFDAMFAGQAERAHELDFYDALCARRAPNLELGCGTGRVTLPLLERGQCVHGLDRSGAMLERLRQKARALSLQPRLFCEDMRRFDLKDRFGAVFLTLRSLSHLVTPGAQLECLRRVVAHLEPGGRVVIDAGAASIGALSRMDGRRRRVREDLLHPETGAALVWYQETIYQHEAQRRDVVDIIEALDAGGQVARRWRWRHQLKVVFRHELDHLLARVGLRVVARYGDFDRSSLRAESPTMLYLAEHEG